MLNNVFQGLRPNGKLFIEVRGVNDPLFGKGKQVERNAYFYDNHYRRFIVLDELVESLEQRGFRVEYAQDRTGFAPYGITSEEKARKTGAGVVKWKVWNTST